MCGIVAVYSPGRPVLTELMANALRSVAHRGPDAAGMWAAPSKEVMIGHTRLAIRDVAGGHQPVENEDGRVVAAVNGELYDIGGLRQELLSRGHRFASRSDSELVVHAWEEWGPGMMARFRGEFAIVLYDARSATFFAARDRFGVKPLLWARNGDKYMFASQARALFDLGVPVRWDHVALHQAASFQYAPPDSTLFAGVSVVPPGKMITIRDGEADVASYWDLDFSRDAAPCDEESALIQVRKTLDDAVRIRLEADVPVAFQLSGGLDSAAVLALAANHKEYLDAFTVSFVGGGAYDEVDKARTIARNVGARLHTVEVSDADIAALLPEAVAYSEGLCVNAHAAAKFKLSRSVREAGFKVVLTGEGSDEMLFGYAHLRADMDGDVESLSSSNSASSGLMLPNGDGLSTSAVREVLGFVPTWISAKAVFGRRLQHFIRREWRERHRSQDPAAGLLASFDLDRMVRGRTRIEQSSYLWTKLALEGYILRTLGDGLEMSSGVEGRVPFLDSRFVDLVRKLPVDLKIRGGTEKWVLREAMLGCLPPEVLAREKHPFLGPPVGPRVIELAHDVIDGQDFKDQPLFSRSRVRGLLDRFPRMSPQERKDFDPVLYFIISFAILNRTFRPRA
jgi:asparagine synthase (glutamine-hydrolysing)